VDAPTDVPTPEWNLDPSTRDALVDALADALVAEVDRTGVPSRCPGPVQA
jgi:hypothetical protein